MCVQPTMENAINKRIIRRVVFGILIKDSQVAVVVIEVTLVLGLSRYAVSGKVPLPKFSD